MNLNTMNIYSQAGTKVYFLDANGYESDKEDARKYFKKGQKLTVLRTVVHSSTTDVYFEETGDKVSFNSVMFTGEQMDKRKLQFHHKRNKTINAFEFAEFKAVTVDLLAKGGITYALQVPTLEEFDAVKLIPEDHWGPVPSIELDIGIARCSNKDNYDKRLGRLKSKHRMKPVGFWARKNILNELVLVAFDSSLKIPRAGSEKVSQR